MRRFHNNEKRKDNAFLLPDGSVVRGRDVAATRLDTQLGRDQLEEFCRWRRDQSTRQCVLGCPYLNIALSRLRANVRRGEQEGWQEDTSLPMGWRSRMSDKVFCS